MHDIFFISYDEPNAEENWQNLKSRFKRAKRVHRVEGILPAHKVCAKKSLTKYFFVVDGDSEITYDFNFSFNIPKDQEDAIWVWRAKNPVNGLEYGYGGVKLLPKKFLNSMPEMKVDMTTSLGVNFRVVDEVASITYFNSSPFNAWRGAFRECVKLSSSIIPRHKEEETNYRLHVWRTINNGAEFGDWVLKGANSGFEYGSENKDNPEKLKIINNFSYLKELFKREF